ncbi:MAG: hypothetical protein O9262_09900, partial [Cyclobacteriaceae bacterium]|nr:hypothetical protein [Cyclobacteriaceae bacterium]
MKRVFTNSMGRNLFGALALLILIFASGESFGQGNFQSNGTGNWTNAGIWNLVSGVDADGIPDADDNVTILNTHTVSVSNGGGGPTTHECNNITINNGGILRNNSGTGIRSLNVYGTLTIDNGGTYTLASTIGVVTHFLNLRGDFVNNGTFTSQVGNSSLQVTFSGTTQSISGSSASTFRNVIIATGSTTVANSTTTVATDLTIQNGASFEVPAISFTVNGTTTIGGGTSGSFLLSSTTGTKRFD